MSENGLCCYSCSRPSAYYDIEPMCNVCLEEYKTKLEDLQRKLDDANAKLGIAKEALRKYDDWFEHNAIALYKPKKHPLNSATDDRDERVYMSGHVAREALEQIEGKK